MITTMKISNTTLTRAELARQAPAVFTRDKPATVSPTYHHLNTDEVVQLLEPQGFYPVAVRQTRGNITYGSHQVVLQNAAFSKPSKLHDVMPQYIVRNDHAGRSALQVWLGLYRLVCTNGLIAGTDWAHISVRHTPTAAATLLDALRVLTERTDLLLDRVRDWQQIQLAPAVVEEFGHRAAIVRWGEERAAGYQPRAVLEARRTEDKGETLWQVFNRAQENLTRGGLDGQTRNGRRVRSRPIMSATTDLSFNTGLWQLAEEFAQQQAA